MGIYEFREFRKYFHHFVGTFTACGHHNHVGLSLLCDSMLENGFSASEWPWDKSGAAFCNGIERVDDTDSGFHDLLGPGLFLISADCNLHRPFLGHGHLNFLILFI